MKNSSKFPTAAFLPYNFGDSPCYRTALKFQLIFFHRTPISYNSSWMVHLNMSENV